MIFFDEQIGASITYPFNDMILRQPSIRVNCKSCSHKLQQYDTKAINIAEWVKWRLIQ